MNNQKPKSNDMGTFFKRKKYVKINIVISKTTLYLSPSFHRVRIKNGPGFLPRPTLFKGIDANFYPLIFQNNSPPP